MFLISSELHHANPDRSGDPQIKALDVLAKTDKRSRAALIREAVEDYLAKRNAPAKSLDDAFGLWGDRTVDGLEYQKRMRDEW